MSEPSKATGTSIRGTGTIRTSIIETFSLYLYLENINSSTVEGK